MTLYNALHGMTVKRKVEKMIDQFDYDFSNYTLTTFVSYLEKLLRRKISIESQTDLDEVSGMWITDREKEMEHVIVNAKLRGYLYEITVLHELGHIMFPKHTTIDMIELTNMRERDEALDSGRLQVLYRSRHETDSPTRREQEREAECFAHAILSRSQGVVVEAHFG